MGWDGFVSELWQALALCAERLADGFAFGLWQASALCGVIKVNFVFLEMLETELRNSGDVPSVLPVRRRIRCGTGKDGSAVCSSKPVL